jgi:hypothetical protein
MLGLSGDANDEVNANAVSKKSTKDGHGPAKKQKSGKKKTHQA